MRERERGREGGSDSGYPFGRGRRFQTSEELPWKEGDHKAPGLGLFLTSKVLPKRQKTKG